MQFFNKCLINVNLFMFIDGVECSFVSTSFEINTGWYLSKYIVIKKLFNYLKYKIINNLQN